MLWRFEQGYDAANGWKAAGNGDGATGLIRVDIRPPPPRKGEPKRVDRADEARP